MDPHKRIRLAIFFVLAFLVVGTVGYRVIDGFSFLDAFYMTVITISTVGFGEIQTLSEPGRVFTIFLILFGVGGLAFAAGAFTEIIIERAANPDRIRKSMEKKISKLEKHVIICGHGRVGAAAAQHLQKNGVPFVIIEHSIEGISELVEKGYLYVQGDATREEMLLKAGIKSATALLAVLNSDPENLFAVLTARELNPVLQIIARTELASSESRMRRAGADTIISPFVAAGQQIAESLVQRAGARDQKTLDADTVQAHLEWLEIGEESLVAGKLVSAATGLMNTKIVGIRRGDCDYLEPMAETEIKAGDRLLIFRVMARPPLAETKRKKVVLIDDNPVILRLYTRLLQRAGFVVANGSTAVEGVQLIEKMQPEVVVVDFHLPDRNGLELCREIREDPDCGRIKLLLFTADDSLATQQIAIAAGVDRVVVKSSDAGEIVKMVLELAG